MKQHPFWIALLSLVALSNAAVHAAEKKSPTPQLDARAENGLRFTQFYNTRGAFRDDVPVKPPADEQGPFQ